MDENFNIDELLKKINSPEMSDTLKNLLSSVSDNNSDTSSDFSGIFSSLSNSFSTPKLDLLNALKPYVNQKRQKKIDQCNNFLSMLNAFSIINSLTKDDDT